MKYRCLGTNPKIPAYHPPTPGSFSAPPSLGRDRVARTQPPSFEPKIVPFGDVIPPHFSQHSWTILENDAAPGNEDEQPLAIQMNKIYRLKIT